MRPEHHRGHDRYHHLPVRLLRGVQPPCLQEGRRVLQRGRRGGRRGSSAEEAHRDEAEGDQEGCGRFFGERERCVLMSRSRRTRAIRSSPRMTTTSRPPVCPVLRSRPRAPRSRPRKPKSRKTIRLRMIILLTINCCVMFRDVCFNLVLECPSIGEMRDIGG